MGFPHTNSGIIGIFILAASVVQEKKTPHLNDTVSLLRLGVVIDCLRQVENVAVFMVAKE